jgi:Flp pilus assembly protein TadD
MHEPTPAPQNRRAPTEDMRRKARNLMEQAQQDHAVGRLGAARMNAKLATIYDPDNEHYKRILAEWERPSTEQGSRPEYVALYEEAQAREDDDDIDGAIALLEKGLRLAPNPAAFHNRIGVLLAMRKRDFERARDEIQKAIALEPGNAHYRNNLGKVMARANRRRGDAVANAR